MAQIYLRDQSFSSPEYAMQCTDFVLDWAYDDYQSQYAGADFMIYPPDNTTRWYVGLRAYGQKLSYTKTEDGVSYRYNLVPDLEFSPSFLPDLQLGVNIQKPGTGSPFSNVEYIGMTAITATSENQPDDWVQNCRTHYYYKNDSNKLVPNTGTAWVVDRVYYKIPNETMHTYFVNFGSKDFKFSVATRLCSNPSQGIYSGCLANGLNTEEIGDTADYEYNFHEGTNTPIVPNYIPGRVQWTYATSINAGSTSKFCQTYPVHFTLSADKTYRSRKMDGTTYSSTYTPTKDVVMFGLLTVYFDNDGLPQSWHITAMSSDVWKSAQMRKQDMGEDTKPAGGQGPQRIGKYDPLGNLIKSSGSGGALVNPLNTPGFVIYKMTSTQFNQFMEKVYSEAALPNWYLGIINQSGGGGGVIDWDKVQSVLPSTVGSGLTNTDNIVFVKTSPVEFDSSPYSLRRLSVGVFGVEYATPQTFQVVTDVTKFFNYTFDYDNNANTFTDLEPYKSASIYFPLAGECQIMPSYLENAHFHVKGGFNLLNDGAAYVCSIQGDNGYIRLSKSGQCAKQADFIITKNYMGEALGKLIPTAALGAATIATGGTTAAALATTAVGAATGFVQDATNMSVVNVPNSATGNAYDECTYGGLKNIYLTSVKAERFASGETVVGGEKTNKRAKVQGYYSYYYIDSIGDIPKGEYANFTDVNMPLVGGMTKAEYDKIMSYLKEGVYI